MTATALDPIDPRSGAALVDALARFTRELRAAGLRVGLSEHVDALEAVRHVGLGDRRLVKAALAATLVKRSVDVERFELLFEMHFGWAADADRPATPAGADAAEPGNRRPLRQQRPPSAAEVDAMVFDVLWSGDVAQMPEVARLAVDRYAGIIPGTHLAPSWYVFRTIQQLRLPAVLERLVAEATLPTSTAMELRLVRDEFAGHIATFRREVVVAVRLRFAVNEGLEGATRIALADEEAGGMDRIESLLGAVDPNSISATEVAELRRALHSLAQKFAARLARDRRDQGRGRIDIRHTLRASMSEGGVPAELRFRHRVPTRPEIVVLVDVSGSVAPYARFFLELVAAMRSSLHGVRAFTFVADVEEVTDAFGLGRSVAESATEVVQRATEDWSGHVSDYGRALSTFWETAGAELGARTTVVVLGDARSNGLPFDPTVARRIRERVRRVYWLNPEPYWEWNEGDSTIAAYEPFVDGVFECRTVRHVEEFIRTLD